MINLEEEEEKEKEKQIEPKEEGLSEVHDSVALKDLIEEGDSNLKIEIEVIYRIAVEVYGKGKDYSGIFEFQPHDQLDLLRYKVPFFRTFANRGYDLIDKNGEKYLGNFKQTFKELDLKSGS
mmetsp:Transcript_16095/g.15493  ORF Transcript_16095/g.15493 Transcript_16095/m.15493 type:complete len:122 (+) Transcript_16095:1539-1904(+)